MLWGFLKAKSTTGLLDLGRMFVDLAGNELTRSVLSSFLPPTLRSLFFSLLSPPRISDCSNQVACDVDEKDDGMLVDVAKDVFVD